MRIAVEVLVPLRLFVYRFLSERRRSLLLALAVVAHLNLKFFKKIQIGGNSMAYNKAREEKKWRLWKEAEEKQLRNLGVNEDDIEKLRVHDWAIFNSDRRYYQRVQETGTYLDELAEDTTQPEVKTVEDFLDSIENQCLYQILIKVDRFTLQIALMKIQGYSTREIAMCLNITEKAVYRRMDRLKEKLKKFFE